MRCVVSVEAHVEALLLRVAVQESGLGVSEGDAMQGLAFLSMLFNTSYVVRYGRGWLRNYVTCLYVREGAAMSALAFPLYAVQH